MKSLFSFLVLIFAGAAAAKPIEFRISGMHCGSCKAAIEKEICATGDFASCEAQLIDAKKKTGELKIETKEGQNAEVADIVKRIAKLGYKAEPVQAKK